MTEKEKYVDESWKESVEKEKEDGPSGGPDKLPASVGEQSEQDLSRGKGPDGSPSEESFEINFSNYVASLAFQAMIFLGEIPNPITQKVEKNFKQAKFIIDTLRMMRDKTSGNLDQPEADLLSATLYELQMKYLELQKPAEGKK
ncbi:MAG: DUF1844 domain-containing protein [Candidatus Omnitrophota bacterium]